MPSRCCIVVHVGAGTHGESKVKRYKQAMRNACQLAIEKLMAGYPAHEVVESAIRVLEDDPVTNAGIGSNLNRLGQVECDAAIMATHPDAFGAVGAIEAIRNPIEAAHAVMLKSSQGPDMHGLVPPMMLVGHGADEWARSNSVATDDKVRHKITEEAMRKYETYMKQVTADKANTVNDEAMQDTVGAVCIDMEGNACAGVSSGGIALKLPGRVGEAAMFGCGCWAERNTKSGAVACSVTGTGEQIMRVMLARECAQKSGDMFTVLNQCFVEFTTTKALESYHTRNAGVILLRQDAETKRMELGVAHTTHSMGYGFMSDTMVKPKVHISRKADKDTLSIAAMRL